MAASHREYPALEPSRGKLMTPDRLVQSPPGDSHAISEFVASSPTKTQTPRVKRYNTAVHLRSTKYKVHHHTCCELEYRVGDCASPLSHTGRGTTGVRRSSQCRRPCLPPALSTFTLTSRAHHPALPFFPLNTLSGPDQQPYTHSSRESSC